MIDVVAEPVAGIVPVDVPDGLPPDEPPADGGTIAVAGPVITNVAVRVPLVGPVEVTVYEPGAVGAVKVTVATPVVAACSGRTRPETAVAHVAVAVGGVDCGWVNVMISPIRQFGCVTLYEPPAVGTAGLSVAAPPATVVVVAPATVVVVAPATVVVVAPATVVVVAAATVVVVVLVVVVVVVVDGPNVKLFGPAPAVVAMVTRVAQNLSVWLIPPPSAL